MMRRNSKIPKVKVGDMVTAKGKETNKWYEGEINKIDSHYYYIQLSNKEQRLRRSNIKVYSIIRNGEEIH